MSRVSVDSVIALSVSKHKPRYLRALLIRKRSMELLNTENIELSTILSLANMVILLATFLYLFASYGLKCTDQFRPLPGIQLS